MSPIPDSEKQYSRAFRKKNSIFDGSYAFIAKLEFFFLMILVLGSVLISSLGTVELRISSHVFIKIMSVELTGT